MQPEHGIWKNGPPSGRQTTTAHCHITTTRHNAYRRRMAPDDPYMLCANALMPSSLLLERRVAGCQVKLQLMSWFVGWAVIWNSPSVQSEGGRDWIFYSQPLPRVHHLHSFQPLILLQLKDPPPQNLHTSPKLFARLASPSSRILFREAWIFQGLHQKSLKHSPPFLTLLFFIVTPLQIFHDLMRAMLWLKTTIFQFSFSEVLSRSEMKPVRRLSCAGSIQRWLCPEQRIPHVVKVRMSTRRWRW